jgi:hypothetical protein
VRHGSEDSKPVDCDAVGLRVRRSERTSKRSPRSTSNRREVASGGAGGGVAARTGTGAGLARLLEFAPASDGSLLDTRAREV